MTLSEPSTRMSRLDTCMNVVIMRTYPGRWNERCELRLTGGAQVCIEGEGPTGQLEAGW